MNWVFRNGIDNVKYASESTHLASSCTSCHGGTDGTAVKADAHAGMAAIPGADQCSSCHASEATLAASSLHTTVKGYEVILAARGFDLADATSAARYEKQCAKCHVANTTSQAACGHCHVSVPDQAGGGLIAGHRMVGTPSTVNNCTACHGSRVKDEYFGQNQALYVRNQFSAALAANDPFVGTTLAADVHKTGGLECVGCHYQAEMHGAGVTAGIDRYGITGETKCLDCHSRTETDVASSAYMGNASIHTDGHIAAMACQVCHAQPYKSCFGCHTQEDATTGAGYFVINADDPTRDLRSPAWSAATTYALGAYVLYGGTTYRSLQATNLNHLPDEAASLWWEAALPAGDALITFRVGKNPRYVTGNGEPKYAVLRHVPVDADVFTYTLEGTSAPGLLPDLTDAATWKYATPHNIAKTTPIASACANCHGADYAKFWLTDPIVDTYGWVPAGTAWETTANAGVTVGAELPMTYTP